MTSGVRRRDAGRPPGKQELRIVAPGLRHAEGLARLSRSFVEEAPGASTIPIGQMSEAEEAGERLFGEDVEAVRLAETREGEVVGCAGVCRRRDVADISVLVHSAYRRRGVGGRLVEQVFDALSTGLEVEALVGARNEASLAAMPAMGFVLDRLVEDQGRTVHVFTRMA